MSTVASPPASEAAEPSKLVVTGVGGSGKSSVAAGLAARLSLALVDGDDLHPKVDVDEMRGGIALDDDETDVLVVAVGRPVGEIVSDPARRLRPTPTGPRHGR